MGNLAVIICCFNGANRLPRTLERLASQEGLDLVIFVDNASTDQSGDVALRVWRGLGTTVPIQVVNEIRSGIVHARQRGLAAASSAGVSYVLFVDDDNWLVGQWVGTIRQIFCEHERVAAIGGCGRPIFEIGDGPDWFLKHQAAYACGPQGDPGVVPFARGFLFGACLALRMEAWTSIASIYAPTLTGRVGNAVLAGDDAELCLMLQHCGWRLWFEPGLVFDHFMPAIRLSPDYLDRLCFGFGLSSRVLSLHKSKLEKNTTRYFIARFRFLYRMYYAMRFLLAWASAGRAHGPQAKLATLRGAAQAV